MQDDLRALILEAQAGSREALSDLLARLQPLLYRFGVRMCGNVEDAEDVLQEALLAVARSVGSYRGESSPSTWLYTIARSFCIKKRRKSKFAPDHEQSLEASLEAQAIPAPGPAPDQAVEEQETRELLSRALAALEPMYREAFVLRDLEGLSAQEAAQVSGISVEALKSRLHRARAAMRERLSPLLEDTAASPSCPEISLVFSQYLEGDISPERCAEMERHLEGCPRCRATCDSLKRSLALCKASPGPELPAPVQRSLRDSIRRILDVQARR
jgi:RNA polymerase sigma-70 factor, ECF subfamily